MRPIPAALADPVKKAAGGPKPRITYPHKTQLTDKERKDQDIATATLAGCSTPVLVLLAALFALIPFIGWIISIALLFFAFGSGTLPFLLASGMTSMSDSGDYNLEGECPYCGHGMKVLRKSGKEADTSFQQCTTCKERVLIKDDLFYTILKSYSASC